MAETKTEEKKPSQPSFLEVTCKSSGKVRRFGEGTEAKFALRVINSKLESGANLALCIAAVKKGEEPVVFGPTSTLVNYGVGWKLETLTTVYGEDDAAAPKHTPIAKKGGKKDKEISLPWVISYVGRILLVFAFMFVLAGALSYFLVVLPDYLAPLSKYTEPIFD